MAGVEIGAVPVTWQRKGKDAALNAFDTSSGRSNKAGEGEREIAIEKDFPATEHDRSTQKEKERGRPS